MVQVPRDFRVVSRNYVGVLGLGFRVYRDVLVGILEGYHHNLGESKGKNIETVMMEWFRTFRMFCLLQHRAASNN